MSRMELFTIEIYILEKRTGCLKVHFNGFSQRTHADISRGLLPVPFSRGGFSFTCAGVPPSPDAAAPPLAVPVVHSISP